MSDCIFCKIAEKEIPATIVYEDDKFIAFKDLDPQAPVHVLLIPKRHIESVDTLSPEDEDVVGHILGKAKIIAKEEGIDNGYRVVSNVGEDGQQSVKHLHFHLLGKRKMTWPPG